MSKYKKPNIDAQKFEGSNPFVDNDFEIGVNKLFRKGIFRREVSGKVSPVEYELEVDQFTKVYRSPKFLEVICKLSPGAQRLYLWIQNEVGVSQDYLWINRVRYMSMNEINSENTYLKAKDELIQRKFITPAFSYKDVFWINPRLLFCGSRINKYAGNVVVKNEVKTIVI